MAEVPVLLRFFTHGEPVPQGSKRAWLDRKSGLVRMTEDQGIRHRDWRAHVMAGAQVALAEAGMSEPIREAVSVAITFYLRRGVGHYGTGRNAEQLAPRSPAYPTKPPDLDKLTRAIFDSLTDARVWVDDAQVCSMLVRKRWTDRFTGEQGVEVKIGVIPTEVVT